MSLNKYTTTILLYLKNKATEEELLLFQSVLNDRALESTSLNKLGSPVDVILDHIRNGRKVEAVKLYKKETNVSLKEAKDIIDNIQNAMLLHSQIQEDYPFIK